MSPIEQATAEILKAVLPSTRSRFAREMLTTLGDEEVSRYITPPDDAADVADIPVNVLAKMFVDHYRSTSGSAAHVSSEDRRA